MISDIITKNNYYQTTEIAVSCELLDIKGNFLFFKHATKITRHQNESEYSTIRF